MPATNFAYPPGEPISIITHTFDAPRAVVWKATTDPKHVANWWGPRGVTTKVVKLDLRPGGAWRFEHHMPDGSIYIFKAPTSRWSRPNAWSRLLAWKARTRTGSSSRPQPTKTEAAGRS